jgi:hypothetical protein
MEKGDVGTRHVVNVQMGACVTKQGVHQHYLIFVAVASCVLGGTSKRPRGMRKQGLRQQKKCFLFVDD